MNSRVMLLLAVLLALAAGVAGYMGYKTTQEARQEAQKARLEAQQARIASTPETGRIPVVIAQRPIPAYHQITAEDISIDYLKLEPPYTYRKLDDLLGKVPQTAIAAGQMIVQGHLDPGSEIARLLQPGERGLAIAIDEVVGGGGFVQPGDTVDVLLFVQGDSRPAASAQVVMRALRVVGMGTRVVGPEGMAPPQGQPEGQPVQRQQSSTAVLAVTEPEATRLMLASSVGVLRLAIRPAAELLACQGGAGAAGAQASATPVPTAPGAATATPAVTAVVTGTPCDDRASNVLAPGKTSPANNRLVRAGALIAPSVAAAPAPAARASAPRPRESSGRPQAAPAAPKQPSIMIFRGLNNSTYP